MNCNSPPSPSATPLDLHLQLPPSPPMAYYLVADSEREAKFKKSLRDANLDSIEWHKQKHTINKLLGLSTSETPLSEIPESIMFESAISSPNSALGSPMDPDSEFVEGSCPHFPRSENPNSDLGFLCDSEPLQPDSDLEFPDGELAFPDSNQLFPESEESDLEFPDGELAFPDSNQLFPESEETFQDSGSAMAFGETALEMESELPVKADEYAGLRDEMMRLLFPRFFDPNYDPSEAAMALGKTAMRMDSEPAVKDNEFAGVGDEMLRILLPRYFALVRPFLLMVFVAI